MSSDTADARRSVAQPPLTREGRRHGTESSPPEDRVIHTELSEDPLDPARAHQEVWDTTAGAVVDFAGIVRDHDSGESVQRLSYTAHPEARSALAAVARRLAEEHPSVRIWAAHRVGDLHIGDHALVAAVASAHRAEAFAVCAELIEQIKAEVPIWKEQFFSDGTREWVGIG